MFSPEAAVPASISSRNPRRRQRTGSEDSVALRHNPKRIRRSGLTSETFRPPDTTRLNGHIEQEEEEEPLENGHAKEPYSQAYTNPDSADLAIRYKEKKKADRGRRPSKNDGSIELTRNDNYIVSQLQSTPESLEDPKIDWHGEISAQLGYALGLTQTQALVWRYVTGTNPTEHGVPLVIKLLHPSSNLQHPLPLGILIPASPEPALLIVMPTSGKITYWESLSSAANADPSRQKQQSVQGIVSGLMSGESIIKITEAEPMGYVLTLSTGRLVHLTVSDSQGKPSINVHFLRDNGAQSGGVFGSLKSVFSSAAWRKDIAAVRPGNSQHRGQRHVVVATTKGLFQTWDLTWNGTHTLVSEIDAKNDLLKALREGGEIFHDKEDHLYEVLDFTILPEGGSGKEIAKLEKIHKYKLLVLTVLKGKESSRYALIGLTLKNETAVIDVVHPIDCYKTSISENSRFRPQVLVPAPAQAAFVVFETSVLLVSLVEVAESPGSQLQMEAHTLPDPFQDSVDFRENESYRVVGCSPEAASDRNDSQSSCAFMIYGFGIIRITVFPMREDQSTLDRATVTARAKIEQAVFYGNLQQNLIDFSPRPETTYAPEDIESAASAVSHSIMNSTSVYLPTITPNVEQQLQRRAAALADLIRYLRKYYPDIGRLTRWKLLWNAEKMASAKAIWKCYDKAIKVGNKTSDTRNLLYELIEAMSEEYKKENQPEQHETDAVRHYFIHDVWRLEYVLVYAHMIVELIFKEGHEDRAPLDQASSVRLVSEANDVHLAALETAFNFRAANAATYGLEGEGMIDGVLLGGYEDLPEVWTSSIQIPERVKTMTDLSRELTKLNEDSEGNEGEPSSEAIIKLAADNPRQVQICCQTYIERFRWLKSRKDPVDKADGETMMHAHFDIRKKQFRQLSEVGQPDQGIKLAEKYHDFDALAAIIDREMQTAESHETFEQHEKRISSYFVKFGTQWANAFFTLHLDGGRAVDVLSNNAHFKKYLTRFLRSHTAYAKLGWINEVHSEQNYVAAADFLQVAQKQETNLWSKKIGLSMGKLSLMAATAKNQAKDEAVKAANRKADHTIAILGIQEKLFKYMEPTIKEALDADAAADLAMQRYGASFVKDKPILRHALERNLRKVLLIETLPPDALIDALTLLDEEGRSADDGDFMDTRFFLSLKALRLSGLKETDPGRQILLKKIIWRRCMIADNWEDVNRTELKDDTQVEVETSATCLFKTLREGYRTGFWEKRPPLLPPSSLLEAGTSVSSLRTSSHYNNMPENALTLLAGDMQTEADLLETYIERGRLEEWWKGVVAAAKAAARDEADQAGEEKLRRRNAGVELMQRLAKRDREVYRPKGDTTGVLVEVDGQGDVVMGS